jgi:hypothetical protein
VSLVIIPGLVGVIYAFYSYRDDILFFSGYYVAFGLIAGFAIDYFLNRKNRPSG